MHTTQATIGRLETVLKQKRLERKQMKLTLRQRLRNWLMSDPEESMVYATADSDEDDVQIDHESAIHFTVIPAAGGKIVQIRYYDRVKDRNNTKLHIITPDEKLEEALAHIFQIEVLSR
jgi:hypothetical protein